MTISAINQTQMKPRHRVNAGVVGCTDLTKVGTAVNTAVAATMAAPGAGKVNVVGQVHWSNTGRTNSRITITSGADTIFDQFTIPGENISFDPPKSGGINQEVVITQAAVAAVTGYLNVNGWVQS